VHSLAKGPDRATLLIHREDGLRLGHPDGAMVRVRSRVGAVTARLQYTDDIMPGVVSLPHGYGHEGVAETLGIAGKLPGPNANAITDDALVEPLIGTAVLNGVPVTLEAAGEAGA
jgi:anaerobic selenocysteine-containing dehydrogenase